jgi:hypothetical protein
MLVALRWILARRWAAPLFISRRARASRPVAHALFHAGPAQIDASHRCSTLRPPWARPAGSRAARPWQRQGSSQQLQQAASWRGHQRQLLQRGRGAGARPPRPLPLQPRPLQPAPRSARSRRWRAAPSAPGAARPQLPSRPQQRGPSAAAAARLLPQQLQRQRQQLLSRPSAASQAPQKQQQQQQRQQRRRQRLLQLAPAAATPAGRCSTWASWSPATWSSAPQRP